MHTSLQVRGEWARAEEEIARVCEELSTMNVGAVGLALYELAELRRQRGDLDGAEAAYAEAHTHGRDPQPGLARAWLAGGRAGDALAALQAAEASTRDPLARTRQWEAMVEAAVAAGDLPAARRAEAALQEAAAMHASSGLFAAATLAEGRLLLAEGDAASAVEALGAARQQWQDLAAPYRVAQARTLLAEAHGLLGDEHAAALELEAASATLARDRDRLLDFRMHRDRQLKSSCLAPPGWLITARRHYHRSEMNPTPNQTARGAPGDGGVSQNTRP